MRNRIKEDRIVDIENRIIDIENSKWNLFGLIKLRKYSYYYLLYKELQINKIGNYKSTTSDFTKIHHTIKCPILF